MQHTPLYDAHVAAGARMVNFSGWEMPINYGSQIEEHHSVRKEAGMFDVSHMTVVDVEGPQSRDYLQNLLANDVARLTSSGKALYSCMLNENGGVIDDLITYYLNNEHYRMVVNAATREKDLQWLQGQVRDFDVEVSEKPELAMLAVQGPLARIKALQAMPHELAPAGELEPFFGGQYGDYFVARTGYTGEDGFEISLPAGQAEELWDQCLSAGVKPCGLGARDTLRLEAGMNLYGQDMDEEVSPLESGLGWTLAMKDEREFIGKSALQSQKNTGVTRRFVGLVLEGRGVLRAGQKIVTEEGEGVTTSGGFSPSLERAIAFARIPVGSSSSCQVDIRGKWLEARIVKPPFVRQGKVCEGVL